MKYLCILIGVGVLLGGCHEGKLATGEAAGGPGKPKITVADYELGEPISKYNLCIVPILLQSDKQPVQHDDYVLIEEAKKNGWIEICELPGRQAVELLLVRNLGPRPILLLAGDLLLGGKQDRIVAKDTIIETKESREVSVFCVEQGRWEGSSLKFEAAPTGAPISVRKSAAFEDQHSVWRDVEEKNRALAESPASTSVRESLQSERIRQRLDSDYESLFAALRKLDRVVGAVLLIDGEIVSCELFGSPALFRAGIPLILQGLIAEAEGTIDTKVSKPVDMDECRLFVEQALGASRQDTFSSGTMSRSKLVDTEIYGAEIRASQQPGSASREFIRGTYAPADDR